MPHQPPSPSVAVIGAGMAGSACAAGLLATGLNVTLFDKSRGVGGRMATRRIPDAGLSFDHGCTHFGARQPRFKAMLARAQAAGVVQPWQPQVWSALPRSSPRTLWVPQGEMPALCRHVLSGAPVRLQHTVQRLQRGARGWMLHLAEGGQAGPFEHVVLAMPPAQAGQLLTGVHDGWADSLRSWPMQPCWTLMAASPEVDWPWDAAAPDRGPLGWVMRNDRKPGRAAAPGTAVWVAHATSAWSADHLEDSPEAVTRALTQALAAQLPGGRAVRRAPGFFTHTAVHRWRYAAAPLAPLGGDSSRAANSASECWWDTRLGLGVCGDYLGSGGGVEAAWRSGDELADTLLAWMDPLVNPVAAAA